MLGKTFLNNRFWKTVFGKPFLKNIFDGGQRFWKTVFEQPFLEFVFGRPCVGESFLLGKTVLGKPICPRIGFPTPIFSKIGYATTD